MRWVNQVLCWSLGKESCRPFADDKETVGELLGRVARVWVETVSITQAVAALKPGI